MSEDFLASRHFSALATNHCADMLKILIANNITFEILCEIDAVEFMPDLCAAIKRDFSQLTVFFIGGYTLNTAKVQGAKFTFEAGFGSDNEASLVSIPCFNIVQISIQSSPIFINLSPRAKNAQAKKQKEAHQKSKDALFANAKNLKIFNNKND